MLPVLNLLAPSTKKMLQRMNILFLIYEAALLIFITSLLGSSVLLAARLMLEERFQQMVSGEMPGTQRIAQISRDIRSINKKLTALGQLTATSPPLSPIIQELVQATPPGITWTAVNVDNQGSGIIAGLAPTRNALIAFKTRLQTSPAIKNVQLPLQYLIAEKDIRFRVTLDLNTPIPATPDL